MKVLYLTKYSRNGASSRLRSYQYFPFLDNEGINITVKPLFDESYLDKLYARQNISKISIIGFYMRRFVVLFSAHKYDRMVIEKEIFPYFFSWFERIFSLLGIRYIVDYDDAIFHNYDLSKNKTIRFFLKNKIRNVMRHSDYVMAGNCYLANKARLAGAARIGLFATVIDINKYKPKDYNASSEKVVIGWIGSPSTFKYVKEMAPVFSVLHLKYPFELHIIGANDALDFEGDVKYIKWSEEAESNLISNFDIGIMPLENTPWELGKCAYKIVQYMGCGVPVVASAVGMNKIVIDHGINGFLAENEQGWIESLSQLIKDAHLRRQFGESGRQKMEREYNLHNSAQKLITLLKEDGAK